MEALSTLVQPLCFQPWRTSHLRTGACPPGLCLRRWRVQTSELFPSDAINAKITFTHLELFPTPLGDSTASHFFSLLPLLFCFHSPSKSKVKSHCVINWFILNYFPPSTPVPATTLHTTSEYQILNAKEHRNIFSHSGCYTLTCTYLTGMPWWLRFIAWQNKTWFPF